ARVREAELLEERRVEGLARAAAAALGRVEDEVGAEALEARRQVRRGAGHLDRLDLVAAGAQAVGDGLNGLGAGELGLFFAVCEPEVVREGDAHDWSDQSRSKRQPNKIPPRPPSASATFSASFFRSSLGRTRYASTPVANASFTESYDGYA